jgi:hypothetical protein
VRVGTDVFVALNPPESGLGARGLDPPGVFEWHYLVVIMATFAGMAHYRAEEGWLITTSTFTPKARELREWLEGLDV